MMYGKFVGEDDRVRFRKALLRADPRSTRHVLAQFDSQREPVHGGFLTEIKIGDLCHGWHRFKRRDFVRLNKARSAAHWKKFVNEDLRRPKP